MPQSLSNVILHIIFSAKNREPWLDSAIRPRMHAYLATICRNLGGEAFRADGTSDRVHKEEYRELLHRHELDSMNGTSGIEPVAAA